MTLSIRDASFAYIGTRAVALTVPAFDVRDGDVAVVVGENGAGKSTLAHLCVGAIPHVIRGCFFGRVTIDGQPLTLEWAQQKARFVPQNAVMSLLGFTVAEERNSFDCAPTMASLGEELLSGIDVESTTSHLSSGEVGKLAIASAFCSRSRLVVLDEPFEYLDECGRAACAKGIQQCATDGRKVIVVGRPGHRDPIAATSYYIVDDKVVRGAETTTMPQSLPRIESGVGSVVMSVRGITIRLSGQRLPLLQDVTFDVHASECVAIRGPNGSGKTTLLSAIGGLRKAAHGEVAIAGKAAKVSQRRQKIAMCFANPDAQVFGRTAAAELRFGLGLLKKSQAAIQEQLDWARTILPFDIDIDPFALSQGQRKLLCLVATFALGKELLLLDEPTAFLDHRSRSVLVELLRQFVGRGGAVVVASHDEEFIAAASHRQFSLRKHELLGA